VSIQDSFFDSAYQHLLLLYSSSVNEIFVLWSVLSFVWNNLLFELKDSGIGARLCFKLRFKSLGFDNDRARPTLYRCL